MLDITLDLQKVASILNNGGVGVLPTDTLYGLVACALQPGSVEKLYDLKERTVTKPFIILISDIEQLRDFGVKLTPALIAHLNEYWPGPVSIILSTSADKFEYLHRGTEALAFRMPGTQQLSELIKKTGPLVAPSANPEGGKPATDIEEAKAYFSDAIDFYVDGGKLNGKASKIIRILGSKVSVIRD